MTGKIIGALLLGSILLLIFLYVKGILDKDRIMTIGLIIAIPAGLAGIIALFFMLQSDPAQVEPTFEVINNTPIPHSTLPPVSITIEPPTITPAPLLLG